MPHAQVVVETLVEESEGTSFAGTKRFGTVPGLEVFGKCGLSSKQNFKLEMWMFLAIRVAGAWETSLSTVLFHSDFCFRVLEYLFTKNSHQEFDTNTSGIERFWKNSDINSCVFISDLIPNSIDGVGIERFGSTTQSPSCVIDKSWSSWMFSQ